MKNQYSQGSHDFSENYSEEASENDDAISNDRLVAFLKQNKPIAPPAAPDFEQQLFAEISKYPQRSVKTIRRSWLPWALLIPAAIATGLTFNWTTNRSQFQMASIPLQMNENEKAAIEQSLIASWNVTDDVVLQVTNIGTTSTDTQLLSGLAPLEYE